MIVVNQKRKISVANGEPIYGPIQFSPHTYFDHVFDKMVYDVKLHLLNYYLSIDTIDLLLSVKSGFHQMQFIDKKHDQLVLEMVNKVKLTINKDVFDKVAID